jgi:transposase-like protein
MTEVLACPNCDSSANIFRRSPEKPVSKLDDGDGRWRCSDCDSEFDEPIRRESKRGPRPQGGLAGRLMDADSSDVTGVADD